MAQGNFDYFAAPRTIILSPMAKHAANTTNNPIDIHGSQGIGLIVLNIATNDAAGAAISIITNILESSPDQTNWTALSYGQATQNALLYTNNTYSSGGILATNPTFTAGTITTPTASTSGFANPYIAPISYTNTNPIVTPGGTYVVGFNTADCGRYLRCSWSQASTGSNFVSSATVTLRRAQGN